MKTALMIKPINLGFGVVISMCAIGKKGQKWDFPHKNLDWAIKFIPKWPKMKGKADRTAMNG